MPDNLSTPPECSVKPKFVFRLITWKLCRYHRLVVTLPETTPVFEAERLLQDLQRAGIKNKWWVINSCLSLVDTQNPFLKAKAQSELPWIDRVKKLSDSNTALIAWRAK